MIYRWTLDIPDQHPDWSFCQPPHQHAHTHMNIERTLPTRLDVMKCYTISCHRMSDSPFPSGNLVERRQATILGNYGDGHDIIPP